MNAPAAPVAEQHLAAGSSAELDGTDGAEPRQLSTSVVLVGLAATSFALAHLSPVLARPGAVPSGLLLLLFASAVTLSLHRPAGGGSLALGCAVLPLLLARGGAVTAAGLGALGLLATELAHRLLESRLPYGPPERRRELRLLVSAARLTLALLGAGVVLAQLMSLRTGPPPAGGPSDRDLLDYSASGLAFVLLLVILEAVELKLRRPGRRALTATLLLPRLYEALGWVVGVVLLLASTGRSDFLLAALLAAVALPTLLAARAAFEGRTLELKSMHLERLGAAPQRIATPGGEMARLADRIRLEISRVLELSWFHFELLSEDDNVRRHWRAGPDGLLEEGWPRPSQKPPPLPGIHRRAEWQLIDRQLEAHGRPLARLRLWCDPRRLGDESLELFELLLPHLAQSVERSLLDREAKHDTLTGMSLRRVLEYELERAFEKACEEGHPLAVVILDLDHFKRINDTWGHAAGDRALQHAARIFAQGGRDTDLCCRFGGEEFALLLRRTDGAEALRVAERHRERLEAATFEHEGEPIPLTLSAGVAAFPESGVAAGTELLELADQALYSAKRAGRNRCLRFRGPARFEGVRSGASRGRRQRPAN